MEVGGEREIDSVISDEWLEDPCLSATSSFIQACLDQPTLR